MLVIGPYLLIVVVAFVGFRRIEAQRHSDCLTAHDGRQVLREVVIEATQPGRATDLTKVPGFADLDPTTQVYVQNLSTALSQGSTSTQQDTLRDRLLALIPEIKCPD